MQVELSKDQMDLIAVALVSYLGEDYQRHDAWDVITDALIEAEELESIDLNDCGDSCKL